MKIEELVEIAARHHMLDQAGIAILECTHTDLCILFVAKNDGCGTFRFSGGELLDETTKEEIARRFLEVGNFITEECKKIGDKLKENQC